MKKARAALFNAYCENLVTGERRRLTRKELQDAHRLWRRHWDIRIGRVK